MTSKGRRLLLADDDPSVQRAISRMAGEFGFELIQVLSGQTVLLTAVSAKPDLIVLDLSFPDADGRDLLAQLKADARTRDIPVLIWSGHGDSESRSRIALNLGAEDYIEKSDARLLMRKIERVMLRIQAKPAA